MCHAQEHTPRGPQGGFCGRTSCFMSRPGAKGGLVKQQLGARCLLSWTVSSWLRMPRTSPPHQLLPGTASWCWLSLNHRLAFIFWELGDKCDASRKSVWVFLMAYGLNSVTLIVSESCRVLKMCIKCHQISMFKDGMLSANTLTLPFMD